MSKRTPPLVVCLIASVMGASGPVAAQERSFTITAATANIRSEPRVASPVLREVPRGTRLTVLAVEGEWIKISTGGDRAPVVGFVSVTLGTLASHEPVAGSSVGAAFAQPNAQFSSPMGDAPRLFGVGGMAGGFSFGVGASARYWVSPRAGAQLGFSRYSLGLGDAGTSSFDFAVSQFSISVLGRFGAPDADDDVVVRPYAGGGINIFRTTSKLTTTFAGASYSDGDSESNLGVQGFGGAEIGFRSVPRFTLSGDIGYYTSSTPFSGIQIGGFAFGISAHWYFK